MPWVREKRRMLTVPSMLRLDPFRLYEIAYLGVQRLTTASNGVTVIDLFVFERSLQS